MNFAISFIIDLVQGMQFLHQSSTLQVHGNLRSSNCLINSRWQLSVSDFGLLDLRATADDEWSDDEDNYSIIKLLWKAPELLRDEYGLFKATQKADLYSFGIILYEIFRRSDDGKGGPYGDSLMKPEEIINQIREPLPGAGFLRPDLEILKDLDLNYSAPDYIIGKNCDKFELYFMNE